MNKDTTFKHDAVNRISAIRARIFELERDARVHITEDMAIEYRDLCLDMINKMDLFEQRHPERIMPDVKGAV